LGDLATELPIKDHCGPGADTWMRLPISLAMTIRGIVSELFFEFLFFRGSNQRLAVGG
jgi:hypothetical protein